MPDPTRDLLAYNQAAWDHQVRQSNVWTVPVSPEAVARARKGDWQIVLTPQVPVPRAWFPALPGCEVLCLAGAGGQQSAILAAAGASVTVFDLSPAQLARDEEVAEREGLTIRTVQGDMADLGVFADATFDLIFHPVSNVFVPDVLPVWREAARVLKTGGHLLAGFGQPHLYLFDDAKMDAGTLEVAHALPFSDLTSLTPQARQRYLDAQEPLCFGHTLTDQIGGQLAAGFQLTGLYEDRSEGNALSEFISTYAATRAVKV